MGTNVTSKEGSSTSKLLRLVNHTLFTVSNLYNSSYIFIVLYIIGVYIYIYIYIYFFIYLLIYLLFVCIYVFICLNVSSSRFMKWNPKLQPMSAGQETAAKCSGQATRKRFS